MSDDKDNLRLKRNLIALNEKFEVEYWTEKLAVGETALRNAVQAVGPRVGDVREFLQGR